KDAPTNITNVSNLTTLTLGVVDPVNPNPSQVGVPPLFTPAKILFPAIDPATAPNISNYSLINTSTNTDESQFITSAVFVHDDTTPNGQDTPLTATFNGQTYIVAYRGHINLTFGPGLPNGTYQFIAHTHNTTYPGLADAAGNFLDDSGVTGVGTP